MQLGRRIILNNMESGISVSEYLDYVMLGTAEGVITDIDYSDVTKPLIIRYSQETKDAGTNPSGWSYGYWSVIFGAGYPDTPNCECWNVFTGYAEHSENPFPASRLFNAVILPPTATEAQFIVTNTFRTVEIYKDTNSTASTTDIHFIVDGESVGFLNPGWATMATPTSSKKVSILCGYVEDQNLLVDRCTKAKLAWCGILDVGGSSTYLHKFIPVITTQNVAGFLDVITNKFYPEVNGKLNCYKDGVLISR